MTELVHIMKPIDTHTGAARELTVVFSKLDSDFVPWPQIGSIDIHPKTKLHFYRQAANHPEPPIDARLLRIIAERIEQLNLKL